MARQSAFSIYIKALNADKAMPIDVAVKLDTADHLAEFGGGNLTPAHPFEHLGWGAALIGSFAMRPMGGRIKCLDELGVQGFQFWQRGGLLKLGIRQA